jgi:hypothetical protein
MFQIALSKDEFNTYQKRVLKMAKNRKNVDFVQFSRAYLGDVALLIREYPTAASIFIFLSKYMDKTNAVVCPQSVLIEITGKKRSAVSNAVTFLKENNYFTVMKSGTTNVYVLNPNVAWSSSLENKQYCKFDGVILVSKKENQEILDKVKLGRNKEIILNKKTKKR